MASRIAEIRKQRNGVTGNPEPRDETDRERTARIERCVEKILKTCEKYRVQIVAQTIVTGSQVESRVLFTSKD